MPDTAPAESTRRPVGRPARIGREQIAVAANEVGLEGLTLKALADHLGVSIAALYHHVSSKDEVIRLAAELSALRLPRPEDGPALGRVVAGGARYIRDAFVQKSALVGQYLDGGITAEDMIGNLDRIMGPLLREGFSAIEAMNAFDAVSGFALGTALGELRAARLGVGNLAAPADPDSPALADLPNLRRLVSEAAKRPFPSFEDRLVLTLTGIATARGLDPDEPRTVVRRVLARERRSRPIARRR